MRRQQASLAARFYGPIEKARAMGDVEKACELTNAYTASYNAAQAQIDRLTDRKGP